MSKTFNKAIFENLFEDFENKFFYKCVDLLEKWIEKEHKRNPQYYKALEINEEISLDIKKSKEEHRYINELTILLKKEVGKFESIVSNYLKDFNDGEREHYINHLGEISKNYYPDSDLLFEKEGELKCFTLERLAKYNLDKACHYLWSENKFITGLFRQYQLEFMNLKNYIVELSDKYTLKRFWESDNTESLKKFRELLLDNDFIDEIDLEIFISHFTAKPFLKKINWKRKQTLLISLFDSIYFAINPKYLTSKNTVSTEQLSKHFLIDGKETNSKKLRDTRWAIQGCALKLSDELVINKIKKILLKYFTDSTSTV